MKTPRNRAEVTDVLDSYVRSQVPGLQYVVVDTDETLFEYAGGWADIQHQTAMTLNSTMMGYSMTKTFTAVAILQLVEQGKLELDDTIDSHLRHNPYTGHDITIRQLLDHTSGIPNPIPLRWAHLEEEDTDFDEGAALARVLQSNPDLVFEPGYKFAYSNIGYWLAGRIVESVAGQSYPDYVRSNILLPLDLPTNEMDFVIPDQALHANGYLAKYSLTNLVKGFVMDRKLSGGYEGKWLRLRSHYLNGPSFGGLIGTARSFARFLQDQLQTESVLFNLETRRMLESQQTDRASRPIPMTLGWHIGKMNGANYLFKEGGGGGFHSEMRLYPAKGLGSVVMVNRTNFRPARFLNPADRAFLEP